MTRLPWSCSTDLSSSRHMRVSSRAMLSTTSWMWELPWALEVCLQGWDSHRMQVSAQRVCSQMDFFSKKFLVFRLCYSSRLALGKSSNPQSTTAFMTIKWGRVSLWMQMAEHLYLTMSYSQWLISFTQEVLVSMESRLNALRFLLELRSPPTCPPVMTYLSVLQCTQKSFSRMKWKQEMLAGTTFPRQRQYICRMCVALLTISSECSFRNQPGSVSALRGLRAQRRYFVAGWMYLWTCLIDWWQLSSLMSIRCSRHFRPSYFEQDTLSWLSNRLYECCAPLETSFE